MMPAQQRRTDAAEGGVLLIVDDEPEIRDILCMLAPRCAGSLAVMTASDAHQAEEILARHDVRAVLTDLRMPGKSGVELIRVVRAARPGTPCAIMTGYQEDVVDGVALSALGLVELLRKPFGFQEVCRAIAALTAPDPADEP